MTPHGSHSRPRQKSYLPQTPLQRLQLLQHPPLLRPRHCRHSPDAQLPGAPAQPLSQLLPLLLVPAELQPLVAHVTGRHAHVLLCCCMQGGEALPTLHPLLMLLLLLAVSQAEQHQGVLQRQVCSMLAVAALLCRCRCCCTGSCATAA